MRTTTLLVGALAAYAVATQPQVEPLSPAATVTLELHPASPTVGSDFTVAVLVQPDGTAGGSSSPVTLGGFVIPVAFDSSRVALKSVTKGSDAAFPSDLAHTDIRKANAAGYVTLVNAQTGSEGRTGAIHLATLTFTANQGGTVRFNANSARSRWEGSLSSAYDPARAGGPELVSYADLTVSVQIQQRDAPYRLVYPSFVSTPSDFQGVAVVNEGLATAAVTFRAFGTDGKLLTGINMTNPSAPVTLPAHAQSAKVVEEIFAMREVFGTDRGWIEVESTSPDTSGFFLVGHTASGITTELDGADVGHTQTTHAIFPVIGRDPARDTRISVVNPGSNAATGSLKLQDQSGKTLKAYPVSIPAHGVFEQTVQSTATPGGGYLELEMSSGEVTGLERFGSAGALACLPAQDVERATSVLWAPHVVSGVAGARYYSEVSVVNASAQGANVIFHLLNDDGAESVSPVTRTIGPKSQLQVRADRLFGLPDPATSNDYTTGFLAVESDRELVGSVIFGDTGGSFLSSLPLLSPSSAKREFYLDHVALGSIGPMTYWTGLALVNASREREAEVTIKLYTPGGKLVGQVTRTVPRRGRLLKLVSELGTAFNVDQFGGFLQFTSNVEVFAFMLFGDSGSTFLSAVPVR